MYYKQENGNWLTAKKVCFPDGSKIDTSDKKNKDGWEWYDDAPQGYLDWKKEQEDALNGSI